MKKKETDRREKRKRTWRRLYIQEREARYICDARERGATRGERKIRDGGNDWTVVEKQ